MRTALSLCIGLLFASSLMSSAWAAPSVTSKDLKGKAICWDGGSRSEFHADGTFQSTNFGKGTWEIIPMGLDMHGDRQSALLDMQKFPGDEFGIVTSSKSGYVKGRYCN
jgi:hypothetical protein